MRRIQKVHGFTLIELMIVVVIIGILAALAIPRYLAASTKSKQSEAKAILKQIFTNQCAYQQASAANTYFAPAGPASKDDPTAFAEIWVEITPPARYTYTIVVAGATFTATATGNIDDDAIEDIWTINHQGVLTNVVNDVLI